ncbi:MAG: RHS repeat-associated core domain-containing protein [Sedimentisphaerales bacterium]
MYIAPSFAGGQSISCRGRPARGKKRGLTPFLSSSIAFKYDPQGNRIWRQSTVSGQTTTRKYIVDVSGQLPTILLEINPDNGSTVKTYVYANSEILMQHDGDVNAARYFYMHDRLGSVREVINTSGSVVKYYTFGPFGQTLEESGTLTNPFMFTGQYYDYEIGQYYLRNRQYDPLLMRITTRDSDPGDYNEPMTLHKYIYCLNNSINRIDTGGYSSRSIAKGYLPWTFQKYMDLWNIKIGPDESPLDIGENGWQGAVEEGSDMLAEHIGERLVEETSGMALDALIPLDMGGAFLQAGPNMYVILYYRLLENGMINSIIMEDFGDESDLYDFQDASNGL